MDGTKEWNLMYLMGNSALGAKAFAKNPMQRSEALSESQKIADNGWHVWVEHKVSGERIFDSKK